ncbi:MAG: NAD(P)/FAD-dependent oxidoreductase [Acidimicrobiales bacterium]
MNPRASNLRAGARAEYDAVVVGSGPNGLVAAVTLAMAGWKVLVVEAASEPGGGTRSAELTRPGMIHDVCSAIHPLALASEALRSLPLAQHGLEWVHPPVAAAHPLDGGRAGLLFRSVTETADHLGADADAYRKLVEPLLDMDLVDSLLAPLGVPKAPLRLAQYGLVGIRSAEHVGRSRFATDEAQGLLAGMAAHSMLSLKEPSTAGYGLMLMMLGHLVGWPLARGGSRAISAALVSLLEVYGGRVECDRPIGSLDDLPAARATLFDVSPAQLVAICGDAMPARYRRGLERFRRGPGVWKVDWALDGPVPWSNPDAGRAATVHVGGTLAEVATAEDEVCRGKHPERPFVLYVQTSQFDRTRAPDGGETGWAYCHVPNGSEVDMTDRIEAQIERFAPGFRDRIVERHVMGPAAMERHNPNYLGGDINGGNADLRQFAARPVPSLAPWRTPVDGVYLCSASTPPGGGVHGMCGLHAARTVLRDHR